MVLAKVQFT